MPIRPASAAAALTLLCAVTAEAKPPSQANSTPPSSVRACPAGDVAITFVARDLANNPLWDVPVEIVWCDSCETVVSACATNDEVEALSDCSVRAFTDSTGTATFLLRAGGACPGGALIVAGGVWFGIVPILSPDLDGDGAVNAADHDLWRACAAAQDPRAELDGSPPIDAADEAVLLGHTGHACGVTVPVHPTTWGGLKTVYR